MQSAITTKLNTIFNQINKSDKFAKVKKIIAVVVIVIPHAGFILKWYHRITIQIYVIDVIYVISIVCTFLLLFNLVLLLYDNRIFVVVIFFSVMRIFAVVIVAIYL